MAAYTVIEQAAMAREREVCLGLIDVVIQKYQKRLQQLPIDSLQRLTCAQKIDVLAEVKLAIVNSVMNAPVACATEGE